MILKKNYLEKLEFDKILDLAKFVVKENFKHHSNNILPKDYEEDVHSIYKEEVNYFKDSEIFVAKDYLGKILGSIRVLKWNYIDVLPLQKFFGINPLIVSENTNVNNIFHIGRFAIKKEVRDINLFKKLMVCATVPICKHKDNIAIAECDGKLLRILNLLGIKTTILGESINYLGSETIPIYINYEGLKKFYNQNKSLVLDDILSPIRETVKLPKSIVLNEQLKNYSLV